MNKERLEEEVVTYCIELGEEDDESYDCIFSSEDFDTEEEALDWGNNIAYYPKHLKMYLVKSEYENIEEYEKDCLMNVNFTLIK